MASAHAEFYRGLEAAAAALAAAPADPAAAARAVHAATDALTAAPAATARACARGCVHCCHFPVGIAFAEALHLAQVLAADPARCDRVLAAAANTASLTWPALVGLPCPLLEDGACSTYAARPIPCRALASADADACAAALRGSPVPVPRDEVAFGRGLGAAAALADHVVPGRRELRSAVAAVLRAPHAAAAAFLAARAVP